MSRSQREMRDRTRRGLSWESCAGVRSLEISICESLTAGTAGTVATGDCGVLGEGCTLVDGSSVRLPPRHSGEVASSAPPYARVGDGLARLGSLAAGAAVAGSGARAGTGVARGEKEAVAAEQPEVEEAGVEVEAAGAADAEAAGTTMGAMTGATTGAMSGAIIGAAAGVAAGAVAGVAAGAVAGVVAGVVAGATSGVAVGVAAARAVALSGADVAASPASAAVAEGLEVAGGASEAMATPGVASLASQKAFERRMGGPLPLLAPSAPPSRLAATMLGLLLEPAAPLIVAAPPEPFPPLEPAAALLSATGALAACEATGAEAARANDRSCRRFSCTFQKGRERVRRSRRTPVVCVDSLDSLGGAERPRRRCSCTPQKGLEEVGRIRRSAGRADCCSSIAGDSVTNPDATSRRGGADVEREPLLSAVVAAVSEAVRASRRCSCTLQNGRDSVRRSRRAPVA